MAAGRILLADDSAIAQRLGERILREEGFEVVSVTDGETALLRLDDVAPDVLVVDAFLPRHSGFDLTRVLRAAPAHAHVGVLLTGSITEPVEAAQATECGADGVLQKPFEAAALLEALQPLLELSRERRLAGEFGVAAPPPPADPVAEAERVRAAVTLAIDAALPRLIDELTAEVLRALRKA